MCVCVCVCVYREKNNYKPAYNYFWFGFFV